ncbi:hypothetical protein KCU81_g1286, partial [Aureobasidium melanogenum]|uniref:Uncharacterized protein n=1 Tax=Aureobasidium melanogenum (strain CBS 110374) TaxID=1043003 RepID=A0A074W4L6_AURM1
MANFTAFITLLVGITTFFTDNLPGARSFTSWGQKLLAAPTQTHFESVTIITPVTFTTTFTTTAIPTFTSSIAPPGNELAIVHTTLPSGDICFFAALKEIICALYALLHLPSDAATLISAIFFASLLLALVVCFFVSSPPAMKPEDLIHLEAQVNEKDELIQKLRTSYAADRAGLLRRLQVQRDEADKRLSAASTQHYSALAKKDQEISTLRHDLAFADLREEGARLKASDEVITLRKELGQLRRERDCLERRLDAQEELVAGAEEAQEKVKEAEERATAAAQEALEANQKVEAAKKAHKEYLVGERARGQAAVDKVKAEVKEVLALKRVEEYKVQARDQDLKALKLEMEKLKAEVAVGAAASVPTPPIFTSGSSAATAQAMRDKLANVPVAVGASFAPGVAGPSVPAPGPSAPAGKVSLGPRPPPKGPFAPKQWGVNSKRRGA